MRCSRVDNVLPVPGVKPLSPPSDVPVGIRSNTTLILATFPPEKDHGATLFKNRTFRVPNDRTRNPGIGITHSIEQQVPIHSVK